MDTRTVVIAAFGLWVYLSVGLLLAGRTLLTSPWLRVRVFLLIIVAWPLLAYLAKRRTVTAAPGRTDEDSRHATSNEPGPS
jgi:hypothetical protein